jgi:hypothetical protein
LQVLTLQHSEAIGRGDKALNLEIFTDIANHLILVARRNESHFQTLARKILEQC